MKRREYQLSFEMEIALFATVKCWLQINVTYAAVHFIVVINVHLRILNADKIFSYYRNLNTPSRNSFRNF